MATIATPNILETEALLDRTVKSPEEMQMAALDLCALGPKAVVVKGGNLSIPQSDDCLVLKGGKINWLKQKRILTENVHGTDENYGIKSLISSTKTMLGVVLELCGPN